MLNLLTIDVEDYYHVSGMKSVIKREEWDNYESRIVNNTEKILWILKSRDVKTTFFVLAWVAERFPELIDKIQRDRHEIASHGYEHRLVYEQTEDEFHLDLLKSKEIIEGITGKRVTGYRAPSFSIKHESLWALDILLEESFRYDTSVFPITHDRCGIPHANRFPHTIRQNGSQQLWEFPPSTLRIFGKNIPIAGGGYFRFFPYEFTRWAIRSLNRRGYPAMVYLHPWEFDLDQPKQKPELKNRIRHYINLSKTESRFIALLRDFKFVSIRSFTQRSLNA